jgi:hypothetical protein
MFRTSNQWCKRTNYSVLLELLDETSGDSVHIGGSLLGKGLSNNNLDTFLTDILGCTNETGSLKLDQAVADVLTSSLTGVLGVGTVTLVSTIVLTEGVDTNLLSNVELVGNGGSAVVKPIAVKWSEFASA